MKPFIAFLALFVSASAGFGQPQSSSQVADAYRTLETQPLWVHPSASTKVKQGDVEAVAKKISPITLRVLVVPQLGKKWQDGSRERRGAYAKWLYTKQLGLKDGIMIVYTKRGVSGYTDRVSEKQLTVLNNQAATRATAGDFTPAIVWLATGISDSIKNAPASTTQANPSGAVSGQSGMNPLPWILGLGVIGVGGFLAVKSMAKKARLNMAKAHLNAARAEAIEGISYLDSYDGLIFQEPFAGQLRAHRDAANMAYEQADQRIRQMQNEWEAPAIRQSLEEALRNVNDGKNVVAEATGGTKTAFVLPAALTQVDQARSPLFEPKPGVCFFTGQYSDSLRPVDISIAGQRRTVMASPEAIESLQSGQAPQVAGQQVQGQFLPWYRVPGYDPNHYQGYGYGGGSSILSDLMLFSAIDNMFDPFGRNHAWSGNSYSNNNSSPSFDSSSTDSGFDSSGSFDFGGGGGFDFGGGDSGGGDSGGSDFGGDF